MHLSRHVFRKTAASFDRKGSDQIRSNGLGLTAVLGAFLLISLMWALFIPLPIEGAGTEWWGNYHPDEHNHVRVIQYIAAHRRLPPFEGTPPHNYYTAVHPPLYHAAGALLYASVTPVVGHAGTLLLLRLAGCALGAGTVFLTYRAARYLLPPRPAVLAAGCVAGVPMFVSLSAAVTNETLAAFTATGALSTMIAGVRHGFGAQRRLYALACWVAAGIASKLTCLPLLPAALLTLWWSRRRHRLAPAGADRVSLPRQMATVISMSVLVTGWWFARNQIIYGDPFLAAAHQRMWSRPPSDPVAAAQARVHAAQIARLSPAEFLKRMVRSGWESFWGIFDGFSRPLPLSAYRAIAVAQAAAALGLIAAWRRGQLRTRVHRRVFGLMLLFAAALVALFLVINLRVFSPQGRYLFPLLLPFGIVTAAGWHSLFPRRLRGAAAAALLLGLLALNVYALIYRSIRPAPGTASTPLKPLLLIDNIEERLIPPAGARDS